MQTVQLNVADEVKAFGDALHTLIGDVVAKKPLATIIADTIPGLLVAIGGYSAIGADIKLIDNQVYLLKSLGSIEGQ